MNSLGSLGEIGYSENEHLREMGQFGNVALLECSIFKVKNFRGEKIDFKVTFFRRDLFQSD